MKYMHIHTIWIARHPSQNACMCMYLHVFLYVFSIYLYVFCMYVYILYVCCAYRLTNTFGCKKYRQYIQYNRDMHKIYQSIHTICTKYIQYIHICIDLCVCIVCIYFYQYILYVFHCMCLYVKNTYNTYTYALIYVYVCVCIYFQIHI